MSFFQAITDAIAQHLPDGGGSSEDLVSVDTAVRNVLAVIERELGDIDPAAFESGAHIPARSFGTGGEAAAVAYHHSRAQQVVYDTLKGVRGDLEKFRDAIADAQKYLADADADAGQQFIRIADQAGSIDVGQRSYEQAQVDHADAPEPTAAPDGAGTPTTPAPAGAAAATTTDQTGAQS